MTCCENAYHRVVREVVSLDKTIRKKIRYRFACATHARYIARLGRRFGGTGQFRHHLVMTMRSQGRQSGAANDSGNVAHIFAELAKRNYVVTKNDYTEHVVNLSHRVLVLINGLVVHTPRYRGLPLSGLVATCIHYIAASGNLPDNPIVVRLSQYLAWTSAERREALVQINHSACEHLRLVDTVQRDRGRGRDASTPFLPRWRPPLGP